MVNYYKNQPIIIDRSELNIILILDQPNDPQMIPYQKEKIDNAICFFAKEHREKTRKPLTQTQLYKYLAFLDFEAFEKRGRPALGLQYKAWPRGPVPTLLYENRKNLKTDCYAFLNVGKTKDGQDIYHIIAHGTPNLDYFSKKEIKEMHRLIEIFADVFVTAGDMSDASHEQIKAWKRTWQTKPNSLIDYRLTFDKDPHGKSETELTFAEECYLVSEAVKSY